MKVKRSKGARRQDALRRLAYEVVDKRSGNQCEATVGLDWAGQRRCLNPAEHHHHRRPRRAGGSTDPTTETASNVVALCAAHHDGVESNRSVAYEMGLLVRAGHDPATTPVLLHVGWCLLAPDGSYATTEGER